MLHKIEVVRRILRFSYELVVSLILYSFLCHYLLKTDRENLMYIGITIMFAVAYVSRDIFDGYIYIALAHLISSVLVGIVNYSAKNMIIIVGVFLYLFSMTVIYLRGNSVLSKVSELPWPSFGICFITYIYGFSMHVHALEQIAYAGLLFMLILYLLMIYTDGLREYVSSTDNIFGLPIKDIVKKNSIMVFFILIFLGAGVIAGPIVGFDIVIKKVWFAIVSLIRIIGLAVGIFFTAIGRFVTTTGNSSFTNKKDDENIMTDVDTASEVMSLLEGCLFLLIAILVLYALFKMLQFVLKLIMTRKVADNDIVETIEMSESVSSNQKLNKRRFFSKYTTEEKLRNIYKHKLKTYRYDIHLSNVKTCRDYENEINSICNESVKELTDIYASVRYGDEKVTKEMLKKAEKM